MAIEGQQGRQHAAGQAGAQDDGAEFVPSGAERDAAHAGDGFGGAEFAQLVREHLLDAPGALGEEPAVLLVLEHLASIPLRRPRRNGSMVGHARGRVNRRHGAQHAKGRPAGRPESRPEACINDRGS